jgi:hypothetical protein
MNFVRLWSIPSKFIQDQNAKTSVMLLNNILEMLMCYAFQSLSSEAMENFMDLDADTIELNVLPPLFDGINVSKEIRNEYREALRNSPDPYIRDFPDVRASQSHFRAMAMKKRACLEPRWSTDQYRSVVIQALLKYDPQLVVDMLNLDTNIDTTALLRQTAVDMDLPNDAEPLVTPFGTASVSNRCGSGTLPRKNRG